MKRLSATLVAAAAALVFAFPAGSHSGATLTIRHQMRGCHTWSYNGGAYSASLAVTMARGTTLTVIDNDVMPQTFVQLSGPKLHIPSSAYMHRMGASTRVAFTKSGVYRFTTKAGDDYPSMGMMKTVGEDYVLKLKVRVT